MKKILIIPTIFPCLFAAACSAPVPPNAGQLRERFGVEIPAYWHASAFHLEASQLRGDRGDRFLGRFRATIALTAPTYVEDHRVGDTIFIRQAGSRGDFKTVYGRADATRAGREWSTRFQMENDPTRSLGQPRDFFTGARVIVVGSKEEQEWEYQQQLREAQAQLEAEAQAQAQREAEQAVRENALIGEWRGTAFGERDVRLVVNRADDHLIAFLYIQGYMETLRVQEMAGGGFLLTGIGADKVGRGPDSYNLDMIEAQISAEGYLSANARDTAGSTGRIAMRKITG
jgi:hypothetical protein